MKVKVLGCSGGIGGRGLRTTSLLVDGDILIDAGTGLADLSLDELAAIDHVFVTHSHLDHIAVLPLMIDAVARLRDSPVTVYANAATLEAMRAHIFNGAIWPDFSEIVVRQCRIMKYETIDVGQRVRLGGRSVAAVPAEHSVSSVGYQLDSGEASLVFTGDTMVNDSFWLAINRVANLRYLIIEAAFSDRDEALALSSKHLCPRLLFAELAKLTVPAQVFVTHLKPGQTEIIADELEKRGGRFPPGILCKDQVFEF
ncbi:MAG: 3',5'-cyclic-nucleotide phosphodiesterase [Candidatus Accumulibacter sp.]|jgi:ribonuclease BN (tRNA processing enzyme)|nr:3',5'-cyclic-nucleotide phosphodiesterase [Accumulibacter sp.]